MLAILRALVRDLGARVGRRGLPDRRARVVFLGLLAWAGWAACGDLRSGEGEGAPTWAEHVAPILYAECAGCHRSDGPAPLPLVTYEQAAALAPAIARAAETRRMPPWLPEPGHVAFRDERRLTDGQVRTLRRWADAGAPAGDTSRAPEAPRWPDGWRLGAPDLVLEMPEPFVVPPGEEDLFRNFVLPVPLSARRWVRGVELRPGNLRVVHHAMMMVDSMASSRRLAALDGTPGYDGMFAGSEAHMPGGFLLGWTPGREPTPEPAGLAWPLAPGDDFVLQLHLQPTAVPETLRARVGLHLSEEPPERRPLVLRLADETLDIPAGEGAYEAADAYRLPVAVTALGVYPHAHYLGRAMEAWAELPDGGRRPLLRIDPWDFDWQDAYRYAEPPELPAGTVLRMRYTYDNSAANPRNPNDPPRRVTYGPTSTDEMGELWLQVVAEGEEARARLAADFARKDFETRLQGWRARLRSEPDDPLANYGLGSVLLARDRPGEAAEHLRRAVEARPDYAHARYNLGVALERLGRPAEAVREYRETVRVLPDHVGAHNNLGAALLAAAAAGEADRSEAASEAERHWRRALEIEPAHAGAHNNLGNLLRARGEPAAAVPHLEAALEARPEWPEARLNLGLALRGAGRPAEAAEAFREAVRLRPDWPEALVALAWTLATHPDPSVRRPGEALEAAERAREAAGEDALTLATLAAARAAGGDFRQAAALAERALEVARGAPGGAALAASLERQLQAYREGRPYLEDPGGG